MNVKDYAIGVEKMVDPMAVGKTHYMQTRLKKLPVCLQRKIITSVTKKAGKMPFVVEPYCTFLFYEIPDPERIQKFMPDGFIPARSAIPSTYSTTGSAPASASAAAILPPPGAPTRIWPAA